MNRSTVVFLSFAVFWIMTLLLGTFQTTVLFWMFQWHPTFQLSLLTLTYMSLYRKPIEGIAFAICAGYAMGLMSSAMESTIVMSCMILFAAIRFFRKRVYTSGAGYFLWVCLGSIIFYHVILIVVASAFENNPPVNAPVLSWILEALLTSLVIRPAYSLFVWIDRKMNRASEMELAG